MSYRRIHIVCVLKVSSEFTPYRAELLARQVRAVHPEGDGVQTVCFTDAPLVNGFDFVEPLEYNLPGWWSKLEAFKFPYPSILLDIDSVVVRRLDPLLDAVRSMRSREFIMLRSTHPDTLKAGRPWMSGLMAWNSRGYFPAFKGLLEDVVNDRSLMEHRSWRRGRNGLRFDQDYIDDWLRNHGVSVTAVQDVCDGITAYKYKGQPIQRLLGPVVPDDVRAVLFHGTPRPWDAVHQSPWLASYVQPGSSGPVTTATRDSARDLHADTEKREKTSCGGTVALESTCFQEGRS